MRALTGRQTDTETAHFSVQFSGCGFLLAIGKGTKPEPCFDSDNTQRLAQSSTRYLQQTAING